ncbi:radical SAM protein [Streptomyces cellulosae]|uniref:radical SAM protein n=1 Tax=Streptomyces cellulosae TaxID=1968 RepID=UPI0004C50759|nr:radical SAM protein [Streptomyces cellulosae]
MHLAELLKRRPVPAAAVFLALTRRCPLSCRHCSTASEPDAEQQSGALLRRFVAGFSRADHPEFLLLTGGEPLLRPSLVHTLATTARAAGTRSYLLTGAFFARGGTTPPTVRSALRAVDHVAVSLDVFHEEYVPRHQVFRVLHELLADGRDASIQACGNGPDDPYLTELTEQVRREFGDRVPMLVGTVQPVGRAREWSPDGGTHGHATGGEGSGGEGTDGEDRSGHGTGHMPVQGLLRAAPCDLAAWPVVGFDGTVTACCNQDTLDQRPVAGHLRLGHVGSTTWPQVRRRVTTAPVLRALRTYGPLQLAQRHLAAPARPDTGSGPGVAALDSLDYCGTCRSLAGAPDALRRIEADGSRPSATLLEQQAIALQSQSGPVGFARRHGAASRAGLVLLGGTGPAEGAA